VTAQASITAQSPGTVQPHGPSEPLTQALLSEPTLQSMHAPPLVPQNFCAMPPTHLPVPSQQPPLHRCEESQPIALQTPATQAVPPGQSVCELQPHAPLLHKCPFVLAVQSRQVLPVEPQLLFAVPTTQALVGLVPPKSQQPPLQLIGLPPTTQLGLQVLVAGSHAVSVGQSSWDVQPHLPETHAWPAVTVTSVQS
jgi:hypothetical protein